MTKILVLTRQIPLPIQATGTTLRVNPVLRYLAGEHEVHLVAAGESRPDAAALAKEASEFCRSVQHLARPDVGRLRRWSRTARSLSDPMLPPWESFDPFSKEYLPAVERLIQDQNPDVLLVIGGPIDVLSRLIRRDSIPPRVVVDWVDAPSLLYERRITAVNPVHRRVRDLRTQRLIDWQRGLNAKIDAAMYIASFDRAHAGEGDNPKVHVVPNGVLEVDRVVPPKQGGPPTLGFLGNMGYGPNVQAAVRLHEKIFTPLAATNPELRLKIIGRGPVPEVEALASERVEVTGSVDSIWPHLAEVDIMVFPMEMGGGLQNKVLEAAAGGCCVVVTNVGAAGVGPIGEETLIIRDSDDEMIDAVTRLLADPGARDEAHDRTRRLLREFDWNEILPRYSRIVLGD